MYKSLVHSLGFVLACLFSSVSFAACMAPHAMTKQIVQAYEAPGPSQFWAHAAWNQAGWPTITYGPLFFQLPPLMQEFTKIHECMHLSIPTGNEFLANCKALLHMRQAGLTIDQENYIRDYHHLPTLQILGMQYGGSGAAFWQQTMMCAGPRN